jgi:quercetin dioxygenase-like cupin family protein
MLARNRVTGRSHVQFKRETTATISVQTLAGHIRLRLPDRTADLPMGQLLVLDQGVRHDVEAVEDSAFLLTMSWHGQKSEINETGSQK